MVTLKSAFAVLDVSAPEGAALGVVLEDGFEPLEHAVAERAIDAASKIASTFFIHFPPDNFEI